jgi:CTP synthase
MKILFVTGSICSSVGKGVILGSIGKLLTSLGFSIKIIKIDPYLNQDAGTMNPQEHGEVWVTEDGKETDLDSGTYFRFINENESNVNVYTAGEILQRIFNNERSGVYLGETVRLNTHMVNEIEAIIKNNNDNKDFILVEIGGTVGETELIPFLNTIKKFQHNKELEVLHINVGKSLYLDHNNEMKLKPLELFYGNLPYGVKVDIQLVRANRKLTDKEVAKINSYSFVDNIITVVNTESIYEIPGLLYENKVLDKILEHFKINHIHKDNLQLGEINRILKIKNNQNAQVIKCCIIGKYQKNIDNYKSIDEALLHACSYFDCKVTVDLFDLLDDSSKLSNYDCVVVSGGFGVNLTEEMINHIGYLRRNNIPTLLICFGLQLALIEIARNILNIADATSLEFSESGSHIICLVDEKHNPKTQNFGGTLRVGIFPIYLNKSSIVYDVYNKYKRIDENQIIKEKFRHRYWINKNFAKKFEQYGVHFSFTGVKNHDDLFGFELESSVHKYFVGIQFHPELTSNIYKPHPLFIELVRKSLEK